MEKDSKSQIIEVALELFGEHSMNDVSLNQVIKASGLSKGAVYHHFPSKKELIKECVISFWEKMTTEVINAPIENMPLKNVLAFLQLKSAEIIEEGKQKNDNIFELYIAMLFYVRKEPELIPIPKKYFNAFKDKLIGCIKNDQERGVLKKDIPAETSALLILTAAEGHGLYTISCVLNNPQQELEDLLNQIYNSIAI
ncbi:TetR/AcrR family transcriptional regulator [Flammeovirga sp. EKP202]|uniref:TetR/AcrR family transcriptional regulator n=1 Tax=Flammeovirga sp. EKP202 TaxID=2770592 RepID=UPI00165FD55A|nr:TetR/AcrR family transcriptional regulator [Flammeovirga sp. EKP202]MBD0403783.1 TetR/AcrR family transcriptional regulator [Flammeovirga sp. EKP202]